MDATVNKKEMGVGEAITELTRKETVTLSDGVVVDVRMCKVKDIPVFLNFMGNLFEDLGVTGGLDALSNAEEIVKAKIQDGVFFLKLISKRSEEVWAIIARFTTMDVAQIQELDVDDAVLLTQRVVEVNYRFFTTRVLPMLRGALGDRLKTRGAVAK